MLAKYIYIFYNANMKTNLFAIRIKELRIKRGYTQTCLGELLGYKKTVICDWETRGKEPKFDVLIKISQIFNVTTDYLLGISLIDDKNK